MGSFEKITIISDNFLQSTNLPHAWLVSLRDGIVLVAICSGMGAMNLIFETPTDFRSIMTTELNMHARNHIDNALTDFP